MNRVWWHRDLLLILGAAFFFVFLGAGSVSFLDPDEGMYGSIAREMAEGGDWVTPHFNGVRYLEKPPLYFWLTALTIVFFGPTEWAVRVWSGLPALGTALLLWRLGDRFYGRFAGIAAPIIFMSGVGVFRYVRVTATDFLLVFSLTLALYGFCRAKLDHGSGLILFYLGMALGVLSKGLVGVVFPVLTVGLFLWCEEHPGTWGLFRKRIVSIYRFLLGNRFGWTGLFIFSLLTVPWHLLAGWRNSGFFEFYVLDNQLLRFLNDRSFVEDDVPIGTLAFLLMILLWFFPWSLVLPVAWRQGFSNPGQAPSPQSLRLLVGLWALVVTVFFSLTSLKLEHYFLPAIPPLSLMVAGTWDGALHSFRSSMQLRRWLVIGALGGTGVGLAMICLSDFLTPGAVLAGLARLNVYYRILEAQGVPSPFKTVSPLIQLIKGLGIVLILGLLSALVLFRRGRPRASFGALVAVAAGIGFLVFRLLFFIEPHHTTKAVAQALTTHAGPGDLIVHEGSLEYSGGLPFYTGRRIHVLNGKRGDLDFGSRYPEGRELFLDNSLVMDRWRGQRRIFLITRPGLHPTILRYLPEERVFFVGRYGSRGLYTNQQIK